MNTDAKLDNLVEDKAASVDGSTSASAASNVRSFAKNSLMLSGIGLSVSLLGFVYRIYIARYLGDTGYGTYVFITTFVSYFSLVSLFGFRNVIVRQIAAVKQEISEYITVGFQLRFASGVVAVILVVIFAFSLKRIEDIRLPVIVCGLSLLTVAISDMFDAAFLGLEKSEYSAISTIFANVVKLVLGILLLVNGYGLLAVLAVFTFTSLLNAILSWILLRTRFKIKLRGSRQRLGELRRYVFFESLPFVYILVLSKVYYKNDVLVLGWLKGDQVVGWYGGAYVAIDFLLLTAGAVSNAMYPIVSRMFADKSGNLATSFDRLCKYVFMGFAPVCIYVSLVVASFLPQILGARFSKGIDALQVLVWMVLFESLTLVAAMLLAATQNQKLSAGVAAFSAITNLGLNLALVPSMSYMGAAWGTAISAVTNCCAATWAVKRVLPDVRPWVILWKPAIAAVCMYIAILYLRQLNHIIALVAGTLIYIAVLLLLRAIDSDDRRILVSLVGNRLKKSTR